jgi:acyl-[acyl-carrier-protein]-phospholipid O-acyltransferase/long-chain-fatty-acid--[acyl-carrier-protein] ligase
MTGLLTGVMLVLLGACAGVFIVPLQVFLQARPPASRKGRMIGTMNLVNWIAIFLAAAAYAACSWAFTLPPLTADGPPRSIISWTFAVMAALILPAALLFRTRDSEP